MPKITSDTKQLIFRLAKKNYLGVREISLLLEQKYGKKVSKSSVQLILKPKRSRLKIKKGPKPARLRYSKSALDQAGLFILLAMDYKVDLIAYFSRGFSGYFPKISVRSIEKIISFLSLSAYCGRAIETSKKNKTFLKLSGQYSFPSKKVQSFLAGITSHIPTVDIKDIKQRLQTVTTVKLYFKNNLVSFLDAKLTCFWDGPCENPKFFETYLYSEKIVKQRITEKHIIIGYTEGQNYLSVRLTNFLSGLRSGLKRVDLLFLNGKTKEIKGNFGPNPSFLIGYFPRNFSKSIQFLEKPPRFKKLTVFDRDFYYTPVLTRFIREKSSEGNILNSVLIKTKQRQLPVLGILTDRRNYVDHLTKQYFFVWPYLDETFLKQQNVLSQKKSVSKVTIDEIINKLPDFFSFKELSDFSKLTDILSFLLKKEFSFLECRNRCGGLVKEKDVLRLTIPSIPKETKYHFNNSCLYIEGKRVVVV